MTNPSLRAILTVAAITLVGVVIYYGIVFDAPLPDHRWLHGKNDLALHALAFFTLSLPILALWPRLRSAVGLAGFAAEVEVVQLWIPHRNPSVEDVLASLVGIVLGMAVIGGLNRTLRHGSDCERAPGAKRGTGTEDFS